MELNVFRIFIVKTFTWNFWQTLHVISPKESSMSLDSIDMQITLIDGACMCISPMKQRHLLGAKTFTRRLLTSEHLHDWPRVCYSWLQKVYRKVIEFRFISLNIAFVYYQHLKRKKFSWFRRLLQIVHCVYASDSSRARMRYATCSHEMIVQSRHTVPSISLKTAVGVSQGEIEIFALLS